MDYLPDFVLKEMERLTTTRKDIDNKICNDMFEYVAGHPEYIFDEISGNPNVTFDYVIAHLEYHWNWFILSLNFPDEYEKYHKQYPWHDFWFPTFKPLITDHVCGEVSCFDDYWNDNCIDNLITHTKFYEQYIVSSRMFTKEKKDLIIETSKSFV